jgi:hypothetical protein
VSEFSIKESSITSLKSEYWSAPAPARITNALMFNLSWFVILFTQSSFIAPAVVIVHLLIHFRFIGKGREELWVIAGVTVLGLLFDQALFRAGVFNMAGESTYAPLWLTCLWPVFATTLMHAFDGFQNRLALAVLFGAVGGALSYVAGVQLTAVNFGSSFWGPITLGILWAVIFPLLLKMSAKMESSRQVDALQAWRPPVQRSRE